MAKTTQEIANDLNLEFNKLAFDLGVLQYNAQDVQNTISAKNVELKNLIVDMNKINDKLKKEKLEAATTEQPPTLELLPEVQNVVQ